VGLLVVLARRRGSISSAVPDRLFGSSYRMLASLCAWLDSLRLSGADDPMRSAAASSSTYSSGFASVQTDREWFRTGILGANLATETDREWFRTYTDLETAFPEVEL
jgi:hypothetical protein